MFNESQHPRDTEGKFTFKNEGSDNSTKTANNFLTEIPFKSNTFNNSKNETPADIIYKDSKIKKQQEKVNSEYRSILLQVLGNNATNADVLYGNNEKLEKKVKEQGLNKQLHSKIMQSKILQGATEKMIGGNYNFTKHSLSRLSGADVQGTLDIAHRQNNMHNPNYIKDAIKLKNFNDPAINSYKEPVRQKVLKEFKDYGYNENTISNIDGYYFKTNSEPSQRIAQSKDFKNIIKSNKQNILSNKKFDISFPAHDIKIAWTSNLKNSIGKAQVLDYYINKEGNLHLKILDTYDFNKDAKDFLNKAGRNQMLKGNLKPYFTIHEIKISKEELDKIWK